MNFDIAYPLAPLIAYMFAGITKFAMNSIKERRLTYNLIGLGGTPSTHTAIVSAPLVLVALREGFDSPIASIGIGVIIIVTIDAMDLRRKIGKHAEAIKRLAPKDPEISKLRISIGHNFKQVTAGFFVGFLVGVVLFFIFN